MKHTFGTDIGRVRQLNEDRVLVHAFPAGNVLAIVADGMGGHHAGDVASDTAVREIEQFFRINPPDAQAHVRFEQLKAAVQAANRVIFEMAQTHPDMHGMGTTVVSALVDDENVVVAHVGDSRAYLFHQGNLKQLTEDHTYVHSLLRSGQISIEEAQHHPRKNVLIRAVGTDDMVEIDVNTFSWNQGDILLLCSDGLSHRINDEQIAKVLMNHGHLEAAVPTLIQMAIDAGGEDNISVVLVVNEGHESNAEGGSASW